MSSAIRIGLPVFIAAALTVGRLFVPTVGHSWSMVFIAVAHFFVGAMAVLIWQSRGRWVLGWLCLLVPTALEAVMFLRGAV